MSLIGLAMQPMFVYRKRPGEATSSSIAEAEWLGGRVVGLAAGPISDIKWHSAARKSGR